MPPYCMECGERIEDGEEYCEHCGMLLQEQEIEVKEIRCPICRGTGEIHRGLRKKGARPQTIICEECAGTGRLMVEM
ncbi:MAG: zinc-ribbon domain-containing protein [Methanomicrobiales archaeon]|nr:zinc-ribbon domain-containing protein [Methanomicrobiales archaeon]